jgi:uncharacterized protein YndB with AHSA1/START domain
MPQSTMTRAPHPLRPFSILPFILAAATAAASPASERAIELHVLVHAPVEKVWASWTTSEGIKTFFAPDAHIELRVDGPYEVYINPLAEPGMKGSDGMRILAIQDRRMIAFTWNAPPDYPEIRKQRTHVVVRLEEVGKGETLVTLRHDGWGTGGDWDKTFQYFSAAWPNVLANLQSSFDKGPMDWTSWMAELKAYMDSRKPAAGAAK